MNGVPTVEKPKLRYERHEAARSAPCWPWTKLPILPGSGVCSPILRLGLGDSPQQLPLVLALPGRHLL